MSQSFGIADLPAGALDAADHFYSEWLPQIRHALDLGNDVVLIFRSAEKSHIHWQRVVVADLARQYAPARANAIAGDDGDAIGAACEYLAHSPGITGQFLAVSSSS